MVTVNNNGSQPTITKNNQAYWIRSAGYRGVMNLHIGLNEYCQVSSRQFCLTHDVTSQKQQKQCYQLTKPIPDWRKDNLISGTLRYYPLALKISQWNQRPFPI
jgi:hypothetical protein